MVLRLSSFGGFRVVSRVLSNSKLGLLSISCLNKIVNIGIHSSVNIIILSSTSLINIMGFWGFGVLGFWSLEFLI